MRGKPDQVADMVSARSAFLLAALTAHALDATGPATALVVKEAPVGALPEAWNVEGSAPREHLLELTFAVKQRGRRELTDVLHRVSDPVSPDYGMHLSNEEVNRLTAPAEGDLDAVFRFIESFGAKPRRATPNGDFVAVTVPVKTAEQMLSAEYVELKHTSGSTVTRAPGGYKLPSRVARAVDFVAPTVHIPGVHRLQHAGHVGKSPHGNSLNDTNSGYNTPPNLRQLYEVGDVEGKAENNKQGVTAFLEQGYSMTSLHWFWYWYCPTGMTCGKGDPKLVGDAVAGDPGTESMLDIETITGVAGNVEAEFWGFQGRSPDNPQNEPFLKWLVQLSNTSDEDVPKVFSTSYGEDEASWSYAAADRLNVEFQKAGARGISLLFASGDQGANCKHEAFMPQGPGSSPYVTAVGGTKPASGWPKPGPQSETAVALSSGGFSNYWPMPDWQKGAVSAYLQQKTDIPDPSRKYNTSGRAYPDISAQASDFIVWAGLPAWGVAGTSCASPTAAAIFTLLNDLRMQNGKSTLGFLNPLIYKSADAFNDITEGANLGCGLNAGWPAKPGWDAVTGWGTPSYASLAKVVMGLPSGRTLGSTAKIVV